MNYVYASLGELTAFMRLQQSLKVAKIFLHLLMWVSVYCVKMYLL